MNEKTKKMLTHLHDAAQGPSRIRGTVSTWTAQNRKAP